MYWKGVGGVFSRRYSIGGVVVLARVSHSLRRGPLTGDQYTMALRGSTIYGCNRSLHISLRVFVPLAGLRCMLLAGSDGIQGDPALQSTRAGHVVDEGAHPAAWSGGRGDNARCGTVI